MTRAEWNSIYFPQWLFDGEEIMVMPALNRSTAPAALCVIRRQMAVKWASRLTARCADLHFCAEFNTELPFRESTLVTNFVIFGGSMRRLFASDLPDLHADSVYPTA
ncbi:hypothetical protein [Paraburkholderia kururiensis]|uniref:Uncharacterized protein n=1 Tax=Paraburkholderia kururiensis TaxID=984307 RepID=A0ABZ0WPK0_9BURK|nr:hypothetical protein [Paraburkholderia kururiensis]WQD79310.1 hypothetical protein U0042_06300 [Paraburkholderia kururiensis]